MSATSLHLKAIIQALGRQNSIELPPPALLSTGARKNKATLTVSRQLKFREQELASASKISLDKLFEQMELGEVKELRTVLRSDVQCTLEAFKKAIAELSTDEIEVRILHEGTGTITESDFLLASASDNG